MSSFERSSRITRSEQVGNLNMAFCPPPRARALSRRLCACIAARDNASLFQVVCIIRFWLEDSFHHIGLRDRMQVSAAFVAKPLVRSPMHHVLCILHAHAASPLTVTTPTTDAVGHMRGNGSQYNTSARAGHRRHPGAVRQSCHRHRHTTCYGCGTRSGPRQIVQRRGGGAL